MPAASLPRALAAAAVAVAVIDLAACTPARPPTAAPASSAAIDVDDALTALTIPPEADAEVALRQLEHAAQSGHQRAAWVVTHYLLDLFDHVRYEPDLDARDRSRRLLFAGLGLEVQSGKTATNDVLDALLIKADRVLGGDRLHAGAQAARTLLELDRQRPQRSQLFADMVAIKAIARGDGPLRANAILRLADFCRTAFRDAAAAPTPYRPGILTYCLYPLYDSDPEPYFATDASARPPEPNWRDLAAGVTELLGQLGDSPSRVAALGATLAREDLAFLAEKKPLLPTRRSPAELGAPVLGLAGAKPQPYEWTPLVLLGDGAKPPAADLAVKLRPIVDADRRQRVALGLAAGAPATTALQAADIARQTGATVLELVVGYSQAVKAPQGDYWHRRAVDDRVERLGILPLSLGALTGDTLELHLVVSAGRWTLLAPSGSLAEITQVADAAAAAGELRKALARVRAAFPDANQLTLVPEIGATYGQLATAAAAARHDESGRAFFRDLALAARAPAITHKTLAARVTRRAAARVVLTPDALAARAAAVRLCYLDALDRAPSLAGTLALELTTVAGVTRAGVKTGPADKGLRACVAQTLNDAMASATIKTARIELLPK